MADPGVREVRPGSTITLQALGFPYGLAPKPSVRLIALVGGAVVTGPTTVGVTEDSPGNYDIHLLVPATLAEADYAAEWLFSGVWVRDEDIVRVGMVVGPRPTVAEIALLLRARTKDETTEVGTFTADTRPTAAQVESMIDSGVADVSLRAGVLSEALEPAARQAAALYTAMAIERSYFPEQAAQADSAYELFRQDYLETVGRLVEAAIDPAPGVSSVVSVPLRSDVYPESEVVI